jgi:hypothetical protein
MPPYIDRPWTSSPPLGLGDFAKAFFRENSNEPSHHDEDAANSLGSVN